MKRKSVGKVQYTKSKLRKSKEWRQFRILMESLSGKVDALTLKPLRKGFNVHHMDMSEQNYAILVPERFRCLNKSSHELVHTLYRYYRTDPSILKRLGKLMKQMFELNK